MFNWKITRLNRRTSDNFVHEAYWTLTKTEGDTAKTIYGIASFGGAVETPFEDLTEETVLNWIWQQVSKEETEAAMKTVLVNKQVPTNSAGLPWGDDE